MADHDVPATPAAAAAQKQADQDQLYQNIGRAVAAEPANSPLHQAWADPAKRPALIAKIKARLAERDKIKEGVFERSTEKANDKMASRENLKMSADGSQVGYSKIDQSRTWDADAVETVKQTVDELSVGLNGASAKHTVSTEHGTGEGGAAIKHENAVNAALDKDGASFGGEHKVEASAGEAKSAVAHEGQLKAGFDGSIDADAGRVRSQENAHGSTETKHAVGFSSKEKQASYELKKKDVVKTGGANPDGTPATHEQTKDVKFHAGAEGAGADGSFVNKTANGTTGTASGGFDIGKNGASAHAGYDILTRGGTSGKLSVSAGTHIYIDEPVEVDGHFEVSYMRANEKGGAMGGGKKSGGASASVGVSENVKHFESGVRVFKTKPEALAWKKEHEKELEAEEKSPDTVEGALDIPIGETRGSGKSNQFGVNGSLAYEGASLHAAKNKTTTEELSIKRLDATHVAVTTLGSGVDEKELGISGGPLDDTKSETESHSKAITWTFDLANPKSKDAFKKFCDDRARPAPGTATHGQMEKLDGKEGKDEITLAGTKQDWKGNTDEKHDRDLDTGDTKDTYTGTQSNDVKAGWVGKTFLGDHDANSSSKIESRLVNGKEDGYTATMKVNGDGAYNREHLGKIFMIGDKPGEATPSGEWTLTTDVSKSTIHAEEQMSMFKGAKTEEDRMRIISEWVAKAGPFAFGGMSAAGDAPLTWDIELAGAGHKDFPGRAKRLEMEEKTKMYASAMRTSPELASTYIVGIDHYIAELAVRHTNVEDRSRYTDLPLQLRTQQLTQIQHFIDEFRRIRTLCMEAEISGAGAPSKDAGKPIAGKTHAADHAHGGPAASDPQAKELADVRSKLSALDAAILRDHQFVITASSAISHARGAVIRRNSPDIEAARRSSRDQFDAAAALDVQQVALDPQIEYGRLQFTSSKDNQLAVGRALAKPTEQKATILASMVDLMKMSAGDLKPVTTENATAKYAAFWATIPGDVGSAETDDDF